nr:hypothetical protein [Tanacetum cinerariifolium]
NVFANDLQHSEQSESVSNTNPLALVVAVQQYPNPYYQAPKSHKSYAPPSKQASSTKSNASTKDKGKEIAQPITPLSKYKNDNQTGQFRNQRTVTVAGAKETETKRVKDYMYHKEKMLLCKQAEKVVSLQAKQADWLEDTNEKIDEQELEAHYG